MPAEFPQEWRDATLAAICDTRPPDGWSGGDEHNRARAMAVLTALSEVGALRPDGVETRWGYLCADDCQEPHSSASEESARRAASQYSAEAGGALVRRWVGPWREVPNA